MKNSRVPTDYIVTRRQARYIAKRNMNKEGLKNVNSHSYTSYKTKGGYTYTVKNPSFFAENWRDYIRRES